MILPLWSWAIGADSIVPFAVEGVGADIERAHIGVGDFDAGGIDSSIEFTSDGQAGCRRGCADEFDDGLVVPERPPSPVPRDEREEPMLDLVPFAGAGRQVQHRYSEAKLVASF